MVLGPGARAGDELLFAVHDKPIATSLGFCSQRARVGAAAGFGETVARQDLHRGETRKPGAPLRRGTESVHHPGAHVVHGKIGRDARATHRQGLENQNRVEAGQTQSRQTPRARPSPPSPAPPPRAGSRRGNISPCPTPAPGARVSRAQSLEPFRASRVVRRSIQTSKTSPHPLPSLWESGARPRHDKRRVYGERRLAAKARATALAGPRLRSREIYAPA